MKSVNCPEERLRADHHKKIAKQKDEVAERQQDLAEAKQKGDADKIAKRERKLAEAQEELKKLEARLLLDNSHYLLTWRKTMSKEHTTEHLRAELKSLSDTLEEVLSSSGEKSKEELSKIRSKAEQALKQSRYRLGETGDAIAKQTRVAAARADEARQNPWTGVGIGAAIGVVLGVLLSRR